MNPGTYQGAGSGASGDGITGFQQSHIITTSQAITPPAGTKRIEALMAGGGGGANANGGGGGFGGLAVMGIPVTGRPLDVVVGAGGTGGNPGSPTQVWSAGMLYAEVGGGGGTNFNQYNSATYDNRNGRSGGSGAGANNQYFGGHGGTPPIGELLWYYAPAMASVSWLQRNTNYPEGLYGTSNAGWGAYFNTNYTTYNLAATRGSLGGGGGGGSGPNPPTYGGGGGGSDSQSYGITGGLLGGGGGGRGGDAAMAAGGSLTSINIWGITGKANGNGQSGGAGGGGGLLGAGLSGSYIQGALLGYQSDWTPIFYQNYIGGDGGLGGGGGGTAYYPGGMEITYDSSGNYAGWWMSPAGPLLRGGNGGNGCAILRFFF